MRRRAPGGATRRPLRQAFDDALTSIGAAIGARRVGLLALVAIVAVAIPAGAAVRKPTITGQQIKPKSIYGRNIASNAVTGLNLKNNDVTTADIKNNSLT